MKKNIYKIRLFISFISLFISTIAVLGLFYWVKVLDVQFSALLQRVVVDFSILALILFVLLILITFIFGRLYCSLICPFGIAQEIVNLIFSKFQKKKKGDFYKNLSFKYFIAFFALGSLIGGSALIIRYIDPYTIFSSMVSLSLFGIIFSLFVFVLVFFKNRFFCSNICPVGAILGLISRISIFKMIPNKDKCVSCSLCAKNCPQGCIDYKNKTIDNERCIKCFKCINVCKKDAINYTIQPKAEIKFMPARRNLIKTVSLFALLALGYKTGVELSKNIAKKIKNIILPPGAQNEQYMINKCLNCNLCINNCPNKILSKANNDFKAVHIDYSKGEKYCKYDCIECSRVCPSGAIKKLSLKEKQNTRIAMAVINQSNCTQCTRCLDVCPKQAIQKDNEGKIVIDASKCIGCGKCATYCYNNAIEIFSINEQKLL